MNLNDEELASHHDKWIIVDEDPGYQATYLQKKI